jgi:serine/threonine protein kinase, bacterial
MWVTLSLAILPDPPQSRCIILQNNKASHPNGYNSYLDWWANQVDRVDVRDTRLVSQTDREMVVDPDINYIMRTGRGRVSPKTVRYIFVKDSNNNWVIQKKQYCINS